MSHSHWTNEEDCCDKMMKFINNWLISTCESVPCQSPDHTCTSQHRISWSRSICQKYLKQWSVWVILPSSTLIKEESRGNSKFSPLFLPFLATLSVSDYSWSYLPEWSDPRCCLVAKANFYALIDKKSSDYFSFQFCYSDCVLGKLSRDSLQRWLHIHLFHGKTE